MKLQLLMQDPTEPRSYASYKCSRCGEQHSSSTTELLCLPKGATCAKCGVPLNSIDALAGYCTQCKHPIGDMMATLVNRDMFAAVGGSVYPVRVVAQNLNAKTCDVLLADGNRVEGVDAYSLYSTYDGAEFAASLQQATMTGEIS